jgi:hypothetical protein
MIITRYVTAVLLMLAAWVRPAMGGTRSAGAYTIAEDGLDNGGSRTTHASCENDASLGGLGGFSSHAASAQVLKSGYPGQLTDVNQVLIQSSPSPINEDAAGQLDGKAEMDDGTISLLANGEVRWLPAGFPFVTISALGTITSDAVYTDTVGAVAGTYHDVTGTATLVVKDVLPDNFRSYAGDTIADNWQVSYFGEENPDASANADPDDDGQDNLNEYIAGTDPNDGTSYFDLWIQDVPGTTNQMDVLYYPRLDRRTYEIQRASGLMDDSWSGSFMYNQSITNETCTVRDLNILDPDGFYRVKIGRAATNCGYFIETLLPTPIAQNGYCVTLTDLNEDGSLDYFVGNSGGGQVLFTIYNGFYPIVTNSGQRLGTNAIYGVASADLNGDSHVDVFAVGPDGGVIWYNDGSGWLTNSERVVTNSYCTSVAIGDLNGDSFNDLFVGRGTVAAGFKNLVLTNNGSGLFGLVEQGAFIQDRTFDVALGDLDNDGNLDAYVANNGDNRCYRNDGQAHFFLWDSDGRSDDSQGVALADLNGDNYRDVVVANAWPGPSYIYLNRTGGVFEPFPFTSSMEDALGVAVADFNGDLRPDIATAGWQNTTAWFNVDGTNFARSAQSMGNDLGQSAAAGDMNGDGVTDLVIINYDTTNRLWLNECMP